MKRKWGILVLVIGSVILVLVLSLTGRHQSGVKVRVEPVRKARIAQKVKATGEITPERKVDISAKVVGEIVELNVREGDFVRRGQVLARIEQEQYRAALEQAEALYQQARVNVERLEYEMRDRERTFRRMQDLHKKGLVSEEQYEQARLAYETVRSQLKAQRLQVRQYASSVRRAKDDLERTIVRAPMDGQVIALNVEVGETAIPSSTNLPGSVLMTIGDVSTMIAEVEVGEVDIVHVKVGQSAEVRVDALGDRVIRGKVVEMDTSGTKDKQTGVIRFKIKIALEDPPPELRPGMTAKVNIITAEHENVLTVPIAAVQKREGETEQHSSLTTEVSDEGSAKKKEVVFVVKNGKAHMVEVQTGISDELNVEIVRGLKAGEAVIVGPSRILRTLKDGDTVVIEEKTAVERGTPS